MRNFSPLWILALATRTVSARNWRDIQPIHGFDPMQPFDMVQIFQARNPLNTPAPTAPTSSPTFPVTSKPTVTPTLPPTQVPTSLPTSSPTFPLPTSNPTDSPTATPDPYPFNPPPDNPPTEYFNYDTRPDAQFGPGHHGITTDNTGVSVGIQNNAWSKVEIPPDSYWKEFTVFGDGPWKGLLENHNPLRNRCADVGYQSPVDVRHNNLGKCEEDHEVRSMAGDFRIAGDNVAKKIESNKLRLVYDRRPCADLADAACQEPDPPYADFPNGWGGFSDAMHVDFKIPSEHLINGKRYDAEMQVYHLHPDRRRMPTQATVIQATVAGYNAYFEGALKAFEYVFERDEALCASTVRRERQLLAEAHNNLGNGESDGNIDYATWAEFSTAMDMPGYQEYADQMERSLQDGKWDPYHPDLCPSIHFYRYEGSITEPPCGEWVSWFITDVPMTISTLQLERMKNILFNHVDYQCRRTSVHFEQSVARPVQPTAGRPIHLCTSADFGPDP